MNTETLPTSSPEELSAAVSRAAALLSAGEAVALPTETVYGLAADALNSDAVLKVFEAKERPFFDPLIVHLPSRDWLERITAVPAADEQLVNALITHFWPGPLTLVLPRQPIVPDVVTSGLETVAVRMSAHPVFRAVTARLNKPLAAPSANRFGRISPTAAAHVESELSARIPLIIDGGPTEHGLESTIVQVKDGRLQVLRPGPVTPDDLITAMRDAALFSGRGLSEEEARRFISTLEASPGLQPSAPGQLKSHYSPGTPLRLRSEAGAKVSSVESTWQPGEMRVGLLGWSRINTEDYTRFAEVQWLSETQNLREAAATLFAKLRQLDEAGLDLILAEPVPESGLGIAIMDRLRKAAAEHAQ